jgi:hypothetical protein
LPDARRRKRFFRLNAKFRPHHGRSQRLIDNFLVNRIAASLASGDSEHRNQGYDYSTFHGSAFYSVFLRRARVGRPGHDDR